MAHILFPERRKAVPLCNINSNLINKNIPDIEEISIFANKKSNIKYSSCFIIKIKKEWKTKFQI